MREPALLFLELVPPEYCVVRAFRIDRFDFDSERELELDEDEDDFFFDLDDDELLLLLSPSLSFLLVSVIDLSRFPFLFFLSTDLCSSVSILD